MSSAKFNWDVFPSTRLEAKNMVSPIGCMYTPFASIAKEVSESHPLKCSSCQSIINQFIRLDRSNGKWWCPFCHHTTDLPETFVVPPKGSTDNEIPAPIRLSSHGTVDYLLPQDISEAQLKGKFVAYVVDTYKFLDQDGTGSDGEDDFMALKKAIADSIRKLPNDCEIIIVTFSDSIVLHKPSQGCIEVCQPNGRSNDDQDKPTIETTKDLDYYFNRVKNTALKISKSDICSRPSLELIDYVLNLKPHFTSSLKPPRATGFSVLTICQLIDNIFPSLYVGKISLFLTGPCTLEPGKIVDELGTLRSHRDILDSSYVKQAQQFYKIFAFLSAGYTMKASIKAAYTLENPLLFSVLKKATKFTFDIYSGSVNQVGVYEMKVLAEAGNGNLFMAESFTTKRFAETLQTNLLLFTEGNTNCVLTVIPSSGLKVSLLVANCTALQSSYQLERDLHLHNQKISDVVTKYDSALKKKYFTNRWYTGNTNKTDTFAIFFEVETVSSSTKLNIENNRQDILVQFQINYYDPLKKCNILRVTTVRRPTTLAIVAQQYFKCDRAMPKTLQSQILKDMKLSESFNAREWVILLTRLLIDKIDVPGGYEPVEEVLDRTNRAIIRLLSNFGGIKVSQKVGSNPYQKLNLHYSINENFKELLPYAYNLCRNPNLTRFFNSSPDETAFYHHLFKSSVTEESSVLLKPVLYVYQYGSLEEVPLSLTSLDAKADKSQYFVMDSLNRIVIYKNVAKREDRLKLHPSNNDKLLSEATISEELKPIMQLIDAQIVSTRKIVPNIILTQTGHSQARFFQARLEAPQRVTAHQTKPTRNLWWPFKSAKSRSSEKLTDEMHVDDFYELLLKKVKAFKLDSIQ